MKIRQGFVSNSSSSSFVIGVGKVLDKATFEEFMQGVEVDLFTTADLHWYMDHGGYFYKDGFTGARVEVKLEPDSLYFSVYESRDLMEDEDGTVWDDGYTESQERIFELENQPFVASVDVTNDYGRDG